MRNCTIRVAKTKALISCAVTAQLICAFVFALAKVRFSHAYRIMLYTSVRTQTIIIPTPETFSGVARLQRFPVHVQISALCPE